MRALHRHHVLASSTPLHALVIGTLTMMILQLPLLLLLSCSSSSSSAVAAFAPSASTHNNVPSSRSYYNYIDMYNYRPSGTVAYGVMEAEDEYIIRARDGSQSSSSPSDDDAASGNRPDVVHIIMYNPSTPQEGIHTVQYPRGSENELLLAFESLDDCVTFARTIRDDGTVMDGEPVPTPTSMVQIERACQGMGLAMAIVPPAS